MWLRAERYLPQKRAMRFIDYINDSDDGIVARAIIRPENPLLTEFGLPAHAGIEFMAQAIAGKRSVAEDRPGTSGVIMSIKNVHIERPYFYENEEVNVTVDTILSGDQYEVCCCVVSQGAVVITAEIAVMENGDGR